MIKASGAGDDGSTSNITTICVIQPREELLEILTSKMKWKGRMGDRERRKGWKKVGYTSSCPLAIYLIFYQSFNNHL